MLTSSKELQSFVQEENNVKGKKQDVYQYLSLKGSQIEKNKALELAKEQRDL